MSATVTHSNHYHAQLLKGNIDWENDTIKIILMNTSFSFDQDAHATLSDVTSSQLASNAYGYTQNDKTITFTVSENDTDDCAYATIDTDPTWSASGGDIGPFGSAIIYDDTTSDDTILFCVDFGTDYTIIDSASWTAEDILIKQEQGS